MVVDLAVKSSLKDKHRLALLGLILIGLSANLIYPGEIFFQSKFLLILVSLFSFLIVFVEESRTAASCGSLKLVFMTLFPMLALVPSLVKTINASRSQDVFWLFFSYVCLFLTLRLLRLQTVAILYSVLAISLVAFWVDLYSLYQYWFGLSDLRNIVLRSTILDERFKSGLLSRIATKRVFAHFPLPNTLAGFITMVLPLNWFLACSVIKFKDSLVSHSGRYLGRFIQSPLAIFFFSVQLSLSLLILALTQSFGGWVCFSGSILFLGLATLNRRKIPAKYTATVLLLLLIMVSAWMVWLTHERGFGLWNLQASENPIALRWINYKTALNIFHDFPLTGVGLGNYGGINPRYQTSPTTVTQYAHNTLLQLLSECGILFLASIGLICLAMIRYWSLPNFHDLSKDILYGFLAICLSASLLAWLIHNLIDIDFYFPSLGALGVFLLGILGNKRETGSTPAVKTDRLEAMVIGPPSKRTSFENESENKSFQKFGRGPQDLSSKQQPRFLALGVVFCILLMVFFIGRAYLAQTMHLLALDYAEAKDFKQAEQCINRAVAMDSHSAPMVILQARLHYINTSQKQVGGVPSLILLREAYEKATRLEPFNASYHFELSRVLYAMGELRLASLSRTRAIELFPSEPKFKVDSPSRERTDQEL